MRDSDDGDGDDDDATWYYFHPLSCSVLPSLLAPSLQAALHRLLNPSPSGHIRKLQQDSNDNNNAEECYQIRLDINLHRNNKFIIERSQSVISLLLSERSRASSSSSSSSSCFIVHMRWPPLKVPQSHIRRTSTLL